LAYEGSPGVLPLLRLRTAALRHHAAPCALVVRYAGERVPPHVRTSARPLAEFQPSANTRDRAGKITNRFQAGLPAGRRRRSVGVRASRCRRRFAGRCHPAVRLGGRGGGRRPRPGRFNRSPCSGTGPKPIRGPPHEEQSQFSRGSGPGDSHLAGTRHGPGPRARLPPLSHEHEPKDASFEASPLVVLHHRGADARIRVGRRVADEGAAAISAGRALKTETDSHQCLSGIPKSNPEGIPAQSPGLRGTSSPGKANQ